MHVQSCDSNLESEIDQIPQSHIWGKAGKENAQYFVCAEKALLTESKSLCDAILDVICAYYVFDIAYPCSVVGIFLFFQQNVFGLKDSQKPPPCLSKSLQNIQAV